MVEKQASTTETSTTHGVVKEFSQDLSQKPAKPVHTATMARPIGFMENWFQRMKYTIVSVLDIKSTNESEHYLDPQILTRALKCTSMRHPILKCNIDRDHAGRRMCLKELIHHPFIEPKFIHSTSTTTTTTTRDDIDWRQVAEKELNVDFHVGSDMPLWRVCVIVDATNKDKRIQSQKLIISMHRCFSDATSMMVIANSILYYYDRMKNLNVSQKEEEEVVVEGLPMLCDAEELCFLTRKMDEEYVLKASKEKLHKFLNYKPVIPLDHENHQEIHRHCKQLCKSGERENLDRLERVTKERNISIRSCIIACTWLSAIKSFNLLEKSTVEKTPLQFDYVMDFRKLIQPILGDEHVGSLIGLTELKLPPVATTMDTKFWDLCQQIQLKLDQSIQDKEPMYWHPIQRNMNIDSNQFVEHLRTVCGRYGDLILEDSGKYPFPRTVGSFEIQSMYTMFGNLPYGWTMALNVGSVQSMSYSCTFDSSLIEESTASNFFNNFVDMVERCHKISDDFTLKASV